MGMGSCPNLKYLGRIDADSRKIEFKILMFKIAVMPWPQKKEVGYTTGITIGR